MVEKTPICKLIKFYFFKLSEEFIVCEKWAEDGDRLVYWPKFF